jgi:hypothetical protein
MRFGKARWMVVIGITLLVPWGTAGSARADFLASDLPTFVNEFRAFLADFPRWDAAHLELPLISLALTPDQQRPEMLLLLWDLWMHDHPPTPPVQTQVIWMNSGSGPGNGSGGGTISSFPGTPGGGGDPGGPSRSAPEPSSLALIACGSLGLLGYRLVRSRRLRSA